MDLEDYLDLPMPDTVLVELEGAPAWPDRHYAFQYGDVVIWDGLKDGTVMCGATLIEHEVGTATWPQGESTPVARVIARDRVAFPAAEGDMHEAFKRGYIDDHPEQEWKRVRDLVLGDRILCLTREALGLGAGDLPAVVDDLGDVIDDDRGARRYMHYTAEHARPGAAQAQGARHNPLADQWVRLGSPHIPANFAHDYTEE